MELLLRDPVDKDDNIIVWFTGEYLYMTIRENEVESDVRLTHQQAKDLAEFLLEAIEK